MSDQRWRFLRDDDYHWYLVPAELAEEFAELLDGDSAFAFEARFDDMRIGTGPSLYTFADPKLER